MLFFAIIIKGENMKTATDYITIVLDYPRPEFEFPDLSSPQGNPMEFFRLATDTLTKNGFRREARELSDLKYPAFNKAFNLIYRFLDFKNPSLQTPFKEDDEYIYYRVKKDLAPTKQIDSFRIKDKEGIIELIEEGHDFSLKNCYGRNHLHYLDDLDAVKTLVEANKTHNWFSLLDLDEFNSTILHSKRNIQTFTYLLNELYVENKDIASLFLFGENVFNKNAFGEVLSGLSLAFKDTKPSDDKLSYIKDFLIILGKIDVNKRDQFLSILDNELPNERLKQEKLGTQLLKEILASELTLSDKPNKKNKI